MAVAGTTRNDRIALSSAVVRDFLSTHARRLALFQAMQLIDASRGDENRGKTIRVKHVPHLHHPNCDLDSVREDDGELVLESYVLGLLGPTSPMPLRLAEEAVWQLRQGRASPLADYLAMLGERHVQWFYRAWLLGRAEHGHGRGGSRLQRAASTLSGNQTVEARDLGVLGLLLNAPRSSAALCALIAAQTGCKTRLDQLFGEWLAIEPADRCALGRALLGSNTTIGVRVWQRVGLFQIHLDVVSYAQYVSLLPGRGAASRQLEYLISRFLTAGLKWRYLMTLSSAEVRPACLGVVGALGETAWTGRPKTPTVSVRLSSPSSRLGMRSIP